MRLTLSILKPALTASSAETMDIIPVCVNKIDHATILFLALLITSLSSHFFAISVPLTLI